MLTLPPRRTWGTRFDTLVDTASPDAVRSRDADADMPAEKERFVNGDRVNRSSPSAAPSPSDAPLLPVRMPHDASVFVASLPPHIPEPELQAHLSAHLSPHATVKHIKLIRDNRGSICAFVQVESAAQAASLIAACNLSLFMDRQIRCEVARAFRTLLVAWRPPGAAVGSGMEETTGQPLRLRRCKGSRYIQVSHGDDAVQADLAHLPNYSPRRIEDPLSGPGIFLPSGIVEGDYEGLKGLLEAFGPLEFITPFEPTTMSPDRHESAHVHGATTVKHKDADEAPSTGDASRPQMWAAKWEHRNDAVSAITALQHVPRLFICWSHTYGRPHQQPYTHRAYIETQSLGSSGIHSTSYLPGTFPADPHSHVKHDANAAAVEAQWAPAGARLQRLHSQSFPTDGMNTQQVVSFSESDFPPLRAEGNGHMLGVRGRGKRSAWMGRKDFIRAGAPSPPPISTSISTIPRMYDDPETSISGLPQTPDLDSAIEPSPITPGFPITPRTSLSGYAPADEPHKDPTYATLSQRHIDESSTDGRELFIGGLDATTWDEERVQNVFGRFGVLEEVRFVKPGYHAPPFKRAFAFIRYASQDASQKAIAEEHLRLYDDRKIKVQLREASMRRWTYRGRGRFHHGISRADRASLDFDHDSFPPEETDGNHVEEVTGHVRFASAPNMASFNIETHSEGGNIVRDTNEGTDSVADDTQKHKMKEVEDGVVDGNLSQQMDADPSSAISSAGSDFTPNASIETQPSPADTTITPAGVTVSPATGEYAHQEQSEQDTAVSSTPPPSNPDAVSTYAPSSEGSAPTSTGYYPSPPSWIPPYAMGPPYIPYGYYSHQVPGQSGTEGSATYPWMTTLYRNVMPFVPWFNPPPGVELAAPPVRPTGYIQRDPGGIFIPVYPPERLGQYMSTVSPTMDQSQTQGQVSSAPPGNWQNIQPHPQLYPVPFPMQPTIMMQQQGTASAQQQLPVTGNGWITGPPQTGHASLQPSLGAAALPSYPSSNAYYQSSPSSGSFHARSHIYGPYDPTLQPVQKNMNRRTSDYGQHHQHRFGPREGRAGSHRRGPGGLGDQSFGNSSGDSHLPYSAKTNGALPTQLTMTPSIGHDPAWNWNSQNR